MSDGGKGSSPRPFSVPQDEFAKRWDAIFGKRDKKDDKDEQQASNEKGDDKRS